MSTCGSPFISRYPFPRVEVILLHHFSRAAVKLIHSPCLAWCFKSSLLQLYSARRISKRNVRARHVPALLLPSVPLFTALFFPSRVSISLPQLHFEAAVWRFVGETSLLPHARVAYLFLRTIFLHANYVCETSCLLITTVYSRLPRFIVPRIFSTLLNIFLLFLLKFVRKSKRL